MKILFINEYCGITSTGRLCCELADELSKYENICKIAYGRKKEIPEKWKHYGVRVNNDLDVKIHALQTRVFDNTGFGSYFETKKFLKWADEFNPDLVWLHNLHGYYINIKLLFEWIKRNPNLQVKWTLHDCWAFTGHCAQFSYVKCEKWKTGCFNCPQKSEYPKSLIFDRSKINWIEKKTIFTGVKKLKVIVPSNWLKGVVENSFLREYPVSVVHNKINTELFKYTKSDFKEKYGIEDKKVILGVANVWTERKGLNDFIKLSRMLDEKYAIVIVGLTRKQMKAMPENIVCVEHTNQAGDLAAIYSAADVYFNATYEDTYPTTNLEALACGTVCVTYKTGGSVESVCEENVVEQGNLKDVVKRIYDICEQ